MKKIKKELPKAQRGYFAKKIAKLIGFSDEALEAARKKQAAIDKKKTATTKKKTNTKDKNNKINTSFLDKQFQFKSPSLRQLNPLRIINPGIPNTGKFIKKNPISTTALGLSLAAYMRSRQPGIDQTPNNEQFDVDPNFSNDYSNFNYNQSNNTQSNINLDSILRNQNLLDFDKRGGRVKAKGGKVAPGMRKQGGGLKMDRNGKFYR